MSPQLVVTDLGRSIDFYVNQLGFLLDFRYEEFYAGVQKDGCSIHLKSGKPSTEGRKSKREQNDLDIVFSVVQVSDFYKIFQQKNIEIIQPLCNRPYGLEFYITDPDGYIIAFLEETSNE